MQILLDSIFVLGSRKDIAVPHSWLWPCSSLLNFFIITKIASKLDNKKYVFYCISNCMVSDVKILAINFFQNFLLLLIITFSEGRSILGKWRTTNYEVVLYSIKQFCALNDIYFKFCFLSGFFWCLRTSIKIHCPCLL